MKPDFDIGLNYQRPTSEPMQHCETVCSANNWNRSNPRISSRFQNYPFSQLANVRNPRLLKSIVEYPPNSFNMSKRGYIPADILNQKVQGIKLPMDKATMQIMVIATGAWSQHWFEHQCSIPVNPVQGQMLLFKTPENWLPTVCMNQVMYLIPRLDGHIVCGSTWRMSVLTNALLYKPSKIFIKPVWTWCLNWPISQL